ncbi:ABC transporter ATP-binding protein [Lacisediminihabitans profunda]|uniref:Spermidine/putrescine import ATP-binding protein PotA n=1 Tax=Lacisediminihabitans profunda TaxID=2594790 RepID=A0A5C8UNI8_9MICO|nr:ABC transporter ATP-binding protein [Lacisediminihabitans profunda]TXN29982.1 ABC transporter ATP-binding protein [Lacisediminihabitans profunda]
MTTTSATTTPRIAVPGTVLQGTRIGLDNIRKDYGGEIPAVDGINLTIQPGEFMTLLGPSGSGKTTTLNLIAGFETLTSGTITLNEQEVSRLPPHKRNLGMLFQSYALFPHMTVAQNVAYPLQERKLPKAEIQERVTRVLQLVQLTGRDDNYPSQLSGGQQQRVALARAIVFEPRALLLDEPLGALDRNLRAALQAEIRRIHREVGATFVFVTHDQEEAMNLSDRIALFNAGHIEQVGTPEALYQKPETLFAAQFFGDSNVFSLGAGPVTGGVTWRGRSWAVDGSTVAERATSLDGSTALMVRPESLEIAHAEKDVPVGANFASARVRDIEYMGSYRTLLLDFEGNVTGKARLDAVAVDFEPGDSVVAWWRPVSQRIVAA